jgi:predicted TIM-barrel fold metal-dependent hydrolase
MTLAFHRNHGGKPDKTDWDELVEQRVSIGGIVLRYFSAVRPLSYMIFAGVFERHPKLKIVGAEVDCGWVPFWVQTMVNHWETQKSWFPVKLERSPADFVGVNIFTSNIDDYVGYDLVKSGKYPYLANMTMFSSDYPHSATIWPHSVEVAEKMTDGMNLVDKRKVLGGNAARVYKFDL